MVDWQDNHFGVGTTPTQTSAIVRRLITFDRKVRTEMTLLVTQQDGIHQKKRKKSDETAPYGADSFVVISSTTEVYERIVEHTLLPIRFINRLPGPRRRWVSLFYTRNSPLLICTPFRPTRRWFRGLCNRPRHSSAWGDCITYKGALL